MNDSFWVAEPCFKHPQKSLFKDIRSQDEYPAQLEEAEQWEKVAGGQTAFSACELSLDYILLCLLKKKK